MIDKFLKAALEALNRIAVSLEAIVKSQGIVAGTTLPPTANSPQVELALVSSDGLETLDDLNDPDDDLDELDDPDDDDGLGDDDDDLDEDPPASKKKKKKASAKRAAKKAKKKKVIGKKTTPESEFTADEVRARLKDVQINTGSAAKAKSILKKNGASTFGGLSVGRYDQVVLECDAINDEYE